MLSQARFLPELGGGGNNGNPPPEDPLEDALASDPSKFGLAVVDNGLLRPGIAILNVCPSLRL